MKISDTINNNGVIQKCELYTELGKGKILNNPNLLADFIGLTNEALSDVWHWCFIASKDSKFDDSSRYTLPVWTENVISGTQSISLLSDVLVIDYVEYKIGNGNWYRLRLMDDSERNSNIKGGDPTGYYLYEGVLILNTPATTDNQIKYHFVRDFMEVTTSDLEVSLGFASPYHKIIPKIVSLEWLKVFRPNSKKIATLSADVLDLKNRLIQLYSFKVSDSKPQRLATRVHNFK